MTYATGTELRYKCRTVSFPSYNHFLFQRLSYIGLRISATVTPNRSWNALATRLALIVIVAISNSYYILRYCDKQQCLNYFCEFIIFRLFE